MSKHTRTSNPTSITGLAEYESAVEKTIAYPRASDPSKCPIYPILGLYSETGEVIGEVADAIRGERPVSVLKMAEELGDVLWYITALALDLRISLCDIASYNIEKIKRRVSDVKQPKRLSRRDK